MTRMHPVCQTCRCVPQDHGTVNCLHCGVLFKRKAATQRFCDQECRNLYRRWGLKLKLEAHGRVWEDRKP